MPALPTSKHSLLHAVEAAVSREYQDEPRAHLGASILGDKCVRRIQLSFRWAVWPEFEPRILRLFQRGHREEEWFVHLLELAGLMVWTEDKDGRQRSFTDGHLGGSADGFCVGVPEAPHTLHLLEFKTHGDKSFKELRKHTSVQASHPKHYDQMQVYMHKFGTTRGVYMAVNKNTDHLYIERVELDKERAKHLLALGHTIAVETRLMEPLSTDPSWYECKMCDYHGICHKGEQPVRSCRTCEYVEPRPNGTWWCHKNQEYRDVKAQRQGCGHHSFTQWD